MAATWCVLLFEAIRGRPLAGACAGIWLPRRLRAADRIVRVRNLERPGAYRSVPLGRRPDGLTRAGGRTLRSRQGRGAIVRPTRQAPSPWTSATEKGLHWRRHCRWGQPSSSPHLVKTLYVSGSKGLLSLGGSGLSPTLIASQRPTSARVASAGGRRHCQAVRGRLLRWLERRSMGRGIAVVSHPCCVAGRCCSGCPRSPSTPSSRRRPRVGRPGGSFRARIRRLRTPPRRPVTPPRLLHRAAPSPVVPRPVRRPSARRRGGRADDVIQEVRIDGNQRIEAGTIRSYMLVQAGDPLRPGPARSQPEDAVRHRPVLRREAAAPGQHAGGARRREPDRRQGRVRGQPQARRQHNCARWSDERARTVFTPGPGAGGPAEAAGLLRQARPVRRAGSSPRSSSSTRTG